MVDRGTGKIKDIKQKEKILCSQGFRRRRRRSKRRKERRKKKEKKKRKSRKRKRKPRPRRKMMSDRTTD